jgi:hypothetical protein
MIEPNDRSRTADAAAMPSTPTNRTLARRFAPNGELAAAVADELDRAAFDPTWVDDDTSYRRIEAAVTTLERS